MADDDSQPQPEKGKEEQQPPEPPQQTEEQGRQQKLLAEETRRLQEEVQAETKNYHREAIEQEYRVLHAMTATQKTATELRAQWVVSPMLPLPVLKYETL